MIQLITAIYDKKAKKIGRPIYQENIEKAIQGVKDALNSTNMNGEYLMPAHREHPEDYCLIQLGYLNESAKEETVFDIEKGTYKNIEHPETPYIQVEEKVIVEFKDIELRDIQQKIGAEQVFNIMNEIKKSNSQDVYDSITKALNDHYKTIESMLKTQKKGWFIWKK